MAWSYKRLWKLLIDKEMKKVELKQAAGITSSALAQMGRSQPVTMESLGKICKVLHCRLEDIVEYIPD